MSSKTDASKETPDSGDSGYLSQEITEKIISGDLSAQVSSLRLTSTTGGDVKNVISESSCQFDSGVCDTASQDLTSRLQTETPVVATLPDVKNIDPRVLIPILLKQDEDGDTQLHIASVHGCQRTISALLRLCPDKTWINLPNDYRHTALHLAVMSKNATVARMLLIAGASLEVKDLAGQTPLHIATELQSIQCLHALLTPLSTTRSSGKKHANHVLNDTNYDGQTCVHLAAMAGNIEVLRTLMHYGADINAKEHHAGWTPLHVAARRGDEALCRLLIANSPQASQARDYAHRRARRYARRSNAERAFETIPLTDSDHETDSDDDDSDTEAFYDVFVKGQTRAVPVA